MDDEPEPPPRRRIDSIIAEFRAGAYSRGMAASVPTIENALTGLEELLQPEPLPSGAQPEQRMVVCGLSWDRYLAFDRRLGDDRPGPRLYYLEGELEIMTTSN